MESRSTGNVYDDFLEFVVERVTPEGVLDFHVSQLAELRARELLERQDAGMLTPAESEELQQMRHFDLLISLLKARALSALRSAT